MQQSRDLTTKPIDKPICAISRFRRSVLQSAKVGCMYSTRHKAACCSHYSLKDLQCKLAIVFDHATCLATYKTNMVQQRGVSRETTAAAFKWQSYIWPCIRQRRPVAQYITACCDVSTMPLHQFTSHKHCLHTSASSVCAVAPGCAAEDMPALKVQQRPELQSLLTLPALVSCFHWQHGELPPEQ